jgi:hypothetical protein
MDRRVDMEILGALRKRYEADIANALANIEVYSINPTGAVKFIGDHADIVSAVDNEVVKLSEAAGKLDVLIEFFRV